VALNFEVEDHVGIQELADTAMRALAKPGGLATDFWKNASSVDLFSPSGEFKGRTVKSTIKLERLRSTIERIIRGLHYHHDEVPLPKSYETAAYLLQGWGHSFRDQDRGIQAFAEAILQKQPVHVGQGVFTYWRNSAVDDPGRAAWLLCFYNRLLFIGVTKPKSETQKRVAL